jgi:hypothetical protein
VQRIAERIGRSLERAGLITRGIENAYLAFDPAEEAPINGLLGASITYRIATGPREGQKLFTLQTLPAEPEGPRREVAESSGFSLHAASPQSAVLTASPYASPPASPCGSGRVWVRVWLAATRAGICGGKGRFTRPNDERTGRLRQDRARSAVIRLVSIQPAKPCR